MFEKAYSQKRSWLMKLHDILLFLAALAMQVLILHYTITVQIISGEDKEIEF
jgi:hypothetical protein